MNIHIREERHQDRPSVSGLVEKAFRNEIHSDHREHLLVERLRESQAFVPGLSLVCEAENKIIGYILLSEIRIKTAKKELRSLAMAPVAVLPGFQGKGIGGKLIKAAHRRAHDLGYQSIVLLGHEKYYPRFGYRPAHQFGISLPFDVPEVNCMAIELEPGALENSKGEVIYPKEFFE